MRKTKKRVFGLLSLALVVATTVFAALLPGPEASAITSVTDTISVRVVGSVPDVNITSPANNSVFVIPDQSLSFDYENVGDVLVTIAYTNKDNETSSYILANFDADYNAGTYSHDLRLLEEGYGYGKYLVTIKGTGLAVDEETGGRVYDEDLVEFWFFPVTGEAAEDENDGLIYLDLEYDKENEDIDTIGINVYDENGNLVTAMSPIKVKAPGDRVELPFSEKDMASGRYRLEITAYNAAGEALYNPYVTYVNYEAIPVPDTGGLFMNLNISRTDYLITGLLIFFPVAIFGLVFIARGQGHRVKASAKRRRR